jgi:hypothetical protein
VAGSVAQEGEVPHGARVYDHWLVSRWRPQADDPGLEADRVWVYGGVAAV